MKTGKVEFVTYSGNITTYTVNVDGNQVIAEMQNVFARDNIKKGDVVHIGWDRAAQITLES